MPPVLQTQRERRAQLMTEMTALSQQEAMTPEESAHFTELDTEITTLDGEIERLERHEERERRAASSRAANNNGQEQDITGGMPRPSGWSVGTEPMIYGRGSGHSYFLDLARQKHQRGDRADGGVQAAEARLRRHGEELDVEMPKRYEARNRAAAKAFEEAFLSKSTPSRERRAMERMLRMGISPFEREKRYISRVDGAGGYFVPPLWLIDQYIPYLRVGRDFVDLWRSFPLPAGTDVINLPRVTIGTATGPQVADGGPVQGRDMTDSFVTAPIRTIAGQQDAALQLLDQSPIDFDEIIFQDLAADYNMQLSGQALVGSGAAGQLSGIWPAGVINTAGGIYVANTNNTASQTWVNGGSSSVVNSIHQAAGQMLSLMARSRLMPPTHWVWHPWVWYYLTTNVDTTLRPLVVPGTPNNLAYNQLGVDTDGPEVMGPVGYYMGLPIVLDPNVPVTFPASGGTNPQITTVSNGQVAPTPGSGVFTPLLVGRWNDCFLWEGEMRTRVLSEVLSGNLQVRFQLYNYVAALTNRYQAYSAVQTGSGPTTVANANAPVSFATLTQFSSTPGNSVLNMMAQGF
jgi:HK97 family phage major capsid protein